MKGKAILYSVWVKAAVFLICIAAAGAAAAEIASVWNVMSSGGGYSIGQTDFSESYEIEQEIAQSSYSLLESITNDTVINAGRGFDGMEYYAENLKTGKVISNTDHKDADYFRAAKEGAYITVEKKGDILNTEGITPYIDSYFVYQDGVPAQGYEYAPSYEEETNIKRDDYVMYIKMTDSYVENIEFEWIVARNTVDGSIKHFPIYAAIIIASLVYFCFCAGRRGRSNEVHMMAVDRVPLDIVNAAGIAVLILGAVIIAVASTESGIPLAYPALGGILCGSAVVVSLTSDIRHLKNKSFIESSIICRCIRFIYSIIKRILKFVFIRIPVGIREIARENVKYLYIIVGSVVISLFTLIIAWFTGLMLYEGDGSLIVLVPLSLAMAAVPVFITAKALKGYNEIKNGLEIIRDGNTQYKIPETGSVITDPISESINELGEGLNNAVEKAVKSERMKSELITNVSHDLKTPLTSIINYTDLLKKQKLSPEEANDYVKIIEQKSKKLKQLTADLFDISKARSGNEELELEQIDYKLLIAQAVAELDSEIEKSGLDFIISLPDEEIEITADGKKLSRVYENLIVNAVKYSMKNTRVYIDMKKINESYVTEIKNIAGYRMNFNGEDITERFVRGDESRTGEGTGLGLAIAKSYVELMGGRLNVIVDGDLFKVIIEMG